jgi:hypothetical protein
LAGRIHVFAVVKRLWGFDKARYRGLAKSATWAFVVTALADIFLEHRHPSGMGASTRGVGRSDAQPVKSSSKSVRQIQSMPADITQPR